MRQIIYANRSLLIGDGAADALLAYAALIAGTDSSDTLHLAALTDEGRSIAVTLLLDSGTALFAETATSELSEPDNAGALDYMRIQTERILAPGRGRPRPQERSTAEGTDK